jgi:hypothetical protein
MRGPLDRPFVVDPEPADTVRWPGLKALAPRLTVSLTGQVERLSQAEYRQVESRLSGQKSALLRACVGHKTGRVAYFSVWIGK